MAYGPPPSPGRHGGRQQHGQPQYGQQQPAWQQQQQQQPPAWQQQAQQPRQAAPPMPEHFGPVGDDEKSWAIMAYVGQFLVGAIAPAVVYLGKARTPFIRRHAAQGLNMGIAAIVVWFVGLLLMFALEALIWIPVIYSALIMAALVWAAIAANRGEFRKVPAVLAWPLIK
ncbi:DUF4870 domain-containing protein [Actinomadura macrotermitis]|uniref:DUF4870 domain-containing protein n=1 Tax=Actinomadura macrotermitis TaxID=2585200 RepID=A0A7K0BNH9_9ACTN|nr:DUF4870 domain-containing protein [Actinomadura macrotermitis]MQY02750.1 hypothetical protein [Actinomadura macrotermitis]